MTTPIMPANPDESVIQTPSAVSPSSADPSTAANVASTAEGQVTMKTTFTSLQDLQKKAPEVYNAMMKSVATNMVNDMKAHQDRLEKIWKDGRDAVSN